MSISIMISGFVLVLCAACSSPASAPQATVTPNPTPPPDRTDEAIATLVNMADVEAGAALFNKEFNTALGPFRCVTCHNIDSDDPLAGPGMLSLPERVGSRVDGQSAEVYLYNSIVDPNAYIAEDYNEGVMPMNYADILTEDQIFQLSAYMLSLGG